MPRLKRLKAQPRGKIQIDADGSEWYILHSSYQNGKPVHSRVQVGSLAHQLLAKTEEEDASEVTETESLGVRRKGSSLG